MSLRAGEPCIQGSLESQSQQPKVTPPMEWMALVPSAGVASHKPIITDSGFRGEDWLTHWAEAYGAEVYPLPKQASRAERRQWSSARQVVETTFANLTESFGLKYLS